jgi:rare lipoprotein A (peptidoglycan hydrolase)
LVTVTLAFGDFVPVRTTKVLGVGRIQSALPATPVASEDKFALATRVAGDVPSEQASGLSEPIARAVTIAEPDPEPEPTPVNTPAPVNNVVVPDVSDEAWITTLATNYATPGDGFLGKSTASGALTTTTSMGVAHKNLPLGTTIELYCPKTGLSCVAVVNDRGPYDGRPDTFDFQMGVTTALGGNTGWYTVQYRIIL